MSCSSAIDRDRSCASSEGRATVFATIPSSVAAFHLAFGPDGWLYVTAPTLSSRDAVYRVSPDGVVETFCDGLGRPQGLAFDSDGHLYVVDAVAGSSAVYRIRTDRPGIKECVLSGGALLGLAFDPLGGLVVSSSETVYRLDVGLRGLLPVQPAAAPDIGVITRGLRATLTLATRHHGRHWHAFSAIAIQLPMLQIFTRKPISELLPEGEHGLRRVLGAGDLVMLAIGAVIGAGIFGAIGTAAAGQVDAERQRRALRGGAGARVLVPAARRRLRAGGALLRRARGDDPAGRAAPMPTPTRRSASSSRGSSAGIWCSSTRSATSRSRSRGATTSRR